ncbi:TPA: hypothetical protein ACOAY7_002793 [Vibrio cholerae]|uniref:hypothetical protein n=1 Tax=Vibrio cholerae TaxID=666 RepID=UPI000C3DA2B0|nr:hypothetical protein [Vibrio phage JSF6]QVV97493.1 hypothetical protein 2017DRC106_0460 [Vibrio phage ICP1]QVV97720.1 hypothetical protein 2017DRC32_0460 [Vibrio phage ICP1]QVV97947.1 hypothetical protein 2017DRC48_0460 [Vibrio phage ICP1]QVV98174.1 hypothetical protein 2017DRC55_0460 [Vibrio phage ICP1]
MLSNFSKNIMLEAAVKNGTDVYAAASSSSSVGSELTTPRQIIIFAAASSGSIVGNTSTPITIPAGGSVSHIHLFNAATGGDWLGTFALTVPETYGSEGSLNVTGLTITLG